MKKMTVTELNTLTDYVVESVLAQKRAEFMEKKTNATKEEFEASFAEAQRLCKVKADAEAALKKAKEELSQFAGKCYMGQFVNVNHYAGEAVVAKLSDETLFDGTNLAPYSLKKDVQRKLVVLKNLGSELDVEAFIKELVASY